MVQFLFLFIRCYNNCLYQCHDNLNTATLVLFLVFFCIQLDGGVVISAEYILILQDSKTINEDEDEEIHVAAVLPDQLSLLHHESG